MGFEERARDALVAQEVANVCQRRARNGKLPIENRGHAPSPGDAPYQQVVPVEVAVDQSRLVIETCEVVRARPHESAAAIAQILRHVTLRVRGLQAQLHKARHWVRSLEQWRRDG